MWDTPLEALQKSAFESMYDQKNDLNLTREAKDLVDMVQKLSTSSENTKQNDDTLNVANMLWNEFERAIINLNLWEDQAKALIEELERIQNENRNNLSPDITQWIEDLINLLTPQANPLLWNTININSIDITDNGFQYSLWSQRNEINQILTKFNQIDTLFWEGYNQLKSNLNTIKNYLNWQNITHGNTAKIITFLERTGVQPNWTIDYRNTNPIPQLVGMLNTFIEGIDNYRKGTLKDHNDVINKYRQQKEDNDRATQEQKADFEEFRNLIMREKVSKLDRRIDPEERENIKKYIRNKKIEGQNIVFGLYDKMKILKFNDNDTEDQEIFDEIMKCIEDNYENEIWERDLNNLLGSKNIVDYYCSLDPDRNKDIDMNQGENWEFIQIGSDDYYQKIRQWDTINTICEWRDFTTNRFMEKFKEADTARMINNLRILKNSFDITTLIENGDQFNNDEEMVNKLLDKAATKFKETRWTNFLNDEDVTIFINMLEFPGIYLPENSALKTATDDVRTTRIDRINNYIEWHANIITEPLPALEETSINNKNLFKWLTAETIANYYTDISGKFNNNQEIKGLLTTLRDWLTSAPNGDWSNDKIRKLQDALWIRWNAKDWRFGPKTFESLQNRINSLLQPSQNNTPGNPYNDIENKQEELSRINPEQITNLRSWLNKNNVADFFNNVITKDSLTEEQKQLLLLTKKWLTGESENDDIKKLQELLTGITVDWKFGIDTFNALRKNFNISSIKVEKKYENIPEWWEYHETMDDWTKVYQITDLKYLVERESFPTNSCVEYNGIFFRDTLHFYDKNESVWQGNWTRNKFQWDDGVLLQYTDSGHEHIQYLPKEKFSQYTYEYKKIEKNDKLFLQILKTLNSDQDNCYGIDSNNNISNKTNPKYYEKNWKLIQKRCDRNLTVPINKYKIRENGHRQEMWKMVYQANVAWRWEYKIYDRYKDLA